MPTGDPCDKTTLLTLVAGLEEVRTGTIDPDGRRSVGPARDHGVVQDHPLFACLTVEKDMVYSLRERGVSGRARSEIAHRYLFLAGLSGVWTDTRTNPRATCGNEWASFTC